MVLFVCFFIGRMMCCLVVSCSACISQVPGRVQVHEKPGFDKSNIDSNKHDYTKETQEK